MCFGTALLLCLNGQFVWWELKKRQVVQGRGSLLAVFFCLLMTFLDILSVQQLLDSSRQSRGLTVTSNFSRIIWNKGFHLLRRSQDQLKRFYY